MFTKIFDILFVVNAFLRRGDKHYSSETINEKGRHFMNPVGPPRTQFITDISKQMSVDFPASKSHTMRIKAFRAKLFPVYYLDFLTATQQIQISNVVFKTKQRSFQIPQAIRFILDQSVNNLSILISIFHIIEKRNRRRKQRIDFQTRKKIECYYSISKFFTIACDKICLNININRHLSSACWHQYIVNHSRYSNCKIHQPTRVVPSLRCRLWPKWDLM